MYVYPAAQYIMRVQIIPVSDAQVKTANTTFCHIRKRV